MSEPCLLWTLLSGAIGAGLIFGTVAAPSPTVRDTPETPPAVIAAVNRVIDGDSLDVHIEGRQVAVGYLDVETPHLRQRCGPEARDRNRQLAGERLSLVEDGGQQLDRIGRRLFRAYTEDGVSVAEVLISEGLGRVVPGAPGSDRLVALQQAAEADGRGCLWNASARDEAA